MTEIPSQVAEALIERFMYVDKELAPIGVYGATKGVIAGKILLPVLTCYGVCNASLRSGGGVSFTDENGRKGSATLLAFSAVKVRRFGNRFAADATVDYHERWNGRRIQKKICDLWAEEPNGMRMFVLVGFDRRDDPFEREFAHLEEEVDWGARDVSFQKRSWPDPHDRRFFVSVAVWWGAK